MDRLISLVLFLLALGAGSIAVVLVLAGFIEFLQSGRWPDQSLLRLGYDSGLLRARWFLAHDWAMILRNLLAGVPAAVALAALVPPCWWLSGRLAQ